MLQRGKDCGKGDQQASGLDLGNNNINIPYIARTAMKLQCDSTVVVRGGAGRALHYRTVRLSIMDHHKTCACCVFTESSEKPCCVRVCCLRTVGRLLTTVTQLHLRLYITCDVPSRSIRKLYHNLAYSSVTIFTYMRRVNFGGLLQHITHLTQCPSGDGLHRARHLLR